VARIQDTQEEPQSRSGRDWIRAGCSGVAAAYGSNQCRREDPHRRGGTHDARGRGERRCTRRLGLGLVVPFFTFGLGNMASSQNTDSSRAILEAAARGDVETLKRLIAAGWALETVNAVGKRRSCLP
jgi:hypothetical protein